MALRDIAKLVGAALALALIVLVISPPTKPVIAAANDWRQQLPVKGIHPPALPDAPVPAGALASRPVRRQPIAPAAAPVRVVEEEPQIDQTVYDDGDRAYAASDRGYAAAPPADATTDRGYRKGYSWAERHQLIDYRYCYRGKGDSFTNGCIAAVREEWAQNRWTPPDYRYRYSAGWGW